MKELLPDSADGDLANVCSWPDEIRSHYRWSSALHFADTPDFKCNYEYCRKFGRLAADVPNSYVIGFALLCNCIYSLFINELYL